MTKRGISFGYESIHTYGEGKYRRFLLGGVLIMRDVVRILCIFFFFFLL